MESTCAICTEQVKIYAFGDCNHPVCHLCCLRLRALYKSNACPICKTENRSVILSKDCERKFQQFILKNMIREKKLSICCDSKDIYDEVMVLLQYNCPDRRCDVIVNNFYQLKDHVKKAHKKFLCEICISNKKVFSHEHALYTQQELQRHKTKGDPDDPSFKGHPSCGFCSQFYYSSDELFEHCRSKHEECHICRKSGIKDQYYRDYDDLYKHFESQHYACADKECKEKKFVVFESAIDLKAHISAEHSKNMTKQQQRETRRIEMDLQFSSGRQPNLRTQPPPGFGRLSSNQTLSAEEVSTSMENLNVSTSNITRPKLNVSRIFDEITEHDLVEMIENDSKIKKSEEIIVPKVLEIINQDPHKWILFKSLCINYLRSVVLPEKFYDQCTEILKKENMKDLLQQIVNLFPEYHQSQLLRVHRDKTEASQDFEYIPSDDHRTSQEILDMKSRWSRGNYGHFMSHSGKAPLNPLGNPQDFPDLPSSSTRPNQQPVQPKFTKSSSKRKEVLLSTALPTNSNTLSERTAPAPSWNVSKKPQMMVPTLYSAPARAASGPPSMQDFPSLPKVQKPKSTFKIKSKQSQDGSESNAWSNTNNNYNHEDQDDDETNGGKKKKKVLLRFG